MEKGKKRRQKGKKDKKVKKKTAKEPLLALSD